MKTITINAKCSDCFSAMLYEGSDFIGDYDGYVPKFFPGHHYGDSVKLDIEIETGRILNWNVPTEADLDIFKKQSDE